MEIKARQTIVLISAVFIFTLGFGIVIPIIPYYTKNVGATAFDLGMLLATFSFLQFFCGPFWGKISDQIGRKPVMMISLLGFAIAFTIAGLSTSLWMLFLAEIIGGALSAGILPAALAYIADITRPSERAGLMGLMGAAYGVGFITGPFLSSVFSVFGLSVPFFAAATISLVTMLAGSVLLPESILFERRLKSKDVLLPLFVAHMVRDTVRQMLSALWTPVSVFLTVTLTISFAIAGFEGTFAYYIMDRFGLASVASSVQLFNTSLSLTGPEVMGIVFALMGAVSVVCQGLIVSRAIELLGEEKVIITGLFICAAGLLLMLIAGDLGSLIAFICVISVGSGLVFPCLNTVVSKRTDPNNQGIMMGIMGSYGSFGRIIGPPVAGYTYVLNMNVPYLISAAIMVMSSGIIVAVMRLDQKKVKDKPVVEPTVSH